MTERTGKPLLSVRDLTKHYPITEGVLRREVGRVRAVDGVSFDLYPGETLGLVGETGCGKSTTARCILRLEEPTAGSVVFGGEEVTGLGGRRLKRFRRKAAMVFQDATSSFDPRMAVGESVAEPLRVHGLSDPERRRAVVVDLLERVGLSAADFDRYPHEFSGGQKQRLALARALVVNPDLVVADEPVSALDVSVQASILSLLEELQAAFDLSILFISHDMSVVREICDRVAVMYLGRIVESGSADTLFAEPQHPYTRALIDSIPMPDPRQRGPRIEIESDVPDPADPPPGCHFHPRCPEVISPNGLDLDLREWRALMDLRVHIRDEGIDLAAVREFIGMDAVEADPSSAEMARAIRGEFGLPDRLSNPGAEAVLADALEEITSGDLQSAERRLREAFESVCESEYPPDHRTPTGGYAACHLLDDKRGA